MDETSIPVFSIFACIREERITGAKDLCYAVENTASAGAFFHAVSLPFRKHIYEDRPAIRHARRAPRPARSRGPRTYENHFRSSPFEIAPGIPACVGSVSKVNAAMAAEILCLRFGVDMILNAGVAGCATDLPTGSLVVASEFIQHDVDTTAVGDPIGLVSTVNRVAFPTWEPARCTALLQSLGHSAVTGRVATGDWFAVKGDRARWIADTFHPTLVEMEGGAIAQVCLRNGVKFAAVKSVSDHLFSDNQTEEYFDFGYALKELGKVILSFALALQKEEA